ncbi:MAG: hypothetical protein AAFU03_08800 [Bacteroidota bacterium]
MDNHVIQDIIDKYIHYWSTQLIFRIEQDETAPNQTIISGLIGPRPKVWTLFMFIYFSIGIIGFFIFSAGVAKLMLGQYSLTLLALPITTLVMLSAYKAGKYGEKLGEDQVELLKQFIKKAIDFNNEN